MGGIVFDPVGNIALSYAWGLGQKTNIEVEWLALFFELELAKQLKITKIIVLRDSKQVIHKTINGYNKGAVKIQIIYERIRQVSENAQVTFYHILRGNKISTHISWQTKEPS